MTDFLVRFGHNRLKKHNLWSNLQLQVTKIKVKGHWGRKAKNLKEFIRTCQSA